MYIRLIINQILRTQLLKVAVLQVEIVTKCLNYIDVKHEKINLKSKLKHGADSISLPIFLASLSLLPSNFIAL